MEKLVAAIVGFLVVGCGGLKDIPSENKVFHAPSSPAEVGLLLENSHQDEIQQILIKYDHVQIRELHKARGIYEVHGLSANEIKSQVSNKTLVNPNKYFHWGKDVPSHFQNFNNDELDDFINSCKKYEPTEGPFKVTSSGRSSLQDESYYTLVNEQIELSIKATDKDTWSFISQLTPSTYSTLKPVITNGSKHTLQTDALGVYKIFFVGKNSEGNCQPKIVQVFASDNPELIRNGLTAEEINTFDDFSFWHLDLLNIRKAREGPYGENVIIAVIDTGLNYNHPYINNNVWINRNEIPNNNIDDDHNGFVDDYLGYDFANSDSYPFDVFSISWIICVIII